MRNANNDMKPFFTILKLALVILLDNILVWPIYVPLISINGNFIFVCWKFCLYISYVNF